jgi:hypothetical protein
MTPPPVAAAPSVVLLRVAPTDPPSGRLERDAARARARWRGGAGSAS